MTADPPFSTVAIVGLGLIGGSIALGLRERWPAVRVIGVDRQAVIVHAKGGGAIDGGGEDAGAAAAADLIVLAAPVRQNVALLAQLAPAAPAGAIITDVGGTKRDIVDAARALALGATFIGGHPIGGAERGGFGFARPDLFKGRPWLFTPHAGAGGGEALDRLFALARGLGAVPSTIDPHTHDRLMAVVSHLPQLTASALMEVIGTAAGEEGLRLAGRGLVDTTRLASSPADVWRDICAANADAIGDALDALIDRLTRLRAGLRDGGAVDTIFEDAARWRGELMKGRD